MQAARRGLIASRLIFAGPTCKQTCSYASESGMHTGLLTGTARKVRRASGDFRACSCWSFQSLRCLRHQREREVQVPRAVMAARAGWAAAAFAGGCAAALLAKRQAGGGSRRTWTTAAWKNPNGWRMDMRRQGRIPVPGALAVLPPLNLICGRSAHTQ